MELQSYFRFFYFDNSMFILKQNLTLIMIVKQYEHIVGSKRFLVN